MRTSTDHILPSHAGSLPRPDALIAANRARDAGNAGNPGDERSPRIRARLLDGIGVGP